MASQKLDRWPLDPAASKEITDQIPPFDSQQMPEFYKRMGLGS